MSQHFLSQIVIVCMQYKWAMDAGPSNDSRLQWPGTNGTYLLMRAHPIVCMAHMYYIDYVACSLLKVPEYSSQTSNLCTSYLRQFQYIWFDKFRLNLFKHGQTPFSHIQIFLDPNEVDVYIAITAM